MTMPITSDDLHHPFAHGGNIAEVRERFALKDQPLLDFSANINPLGMPDSIRNAILSALPSLLHYPDSECRTLRRKLANHLEVSPDNILVGNGSTEMMFLAARALLRGDACVIDPTFTEYRHAVEHVGRRCGSIMASEAHDFRIDAELLKEGAHRYSMVFLCNPNNPTGVLTAREDILAVVVRFPQVMFIIDEAFCDFLLLDENFSVLRDAVRLRNLVVLRSLTKFYAIPGLRVGYVVAHQEIISAMRRFKEPWSVNSLAEAAGCAAIADVEFARKTREQVAALKEEMKMQIGTIAGLQPFQPSVNFMLVKIIKEGVSVEALQEQLLRDGIIIRNCSNFPGLDGRFFRVAVRSKSENARLVQALRQAMEAQI